MSNCEISETQKWVNNHRRIYRFIITEIKKRNRQNRAVYMIDVIRQIKWHKGINVDVPDRAELKKIILAEFPDLKICDEHKEDKRLNTMLNVSILSNEDVEKVKYYAMSMLQIIEGAHKRAGDVNVG